MVAAIVMFDSGRTNLSACEEHKGVVAVAGGVTALVDLTFQWSTRGDGVLARAVGALDNRAADDKCSLDDKCILEVALAGSVYASLMLAWNYKFEGVQEQAAQALANVAAQGDRNNYSAVGQEVGGLDALIQLMHSPHDDVRQEAAGALWNLSVDGRNQEVIAAAGGIEALVALAQSCSNASPGLQEGAAGALWGLEVTIIAIGWKGGVSPLIALAGSEAEDETVLGALWNLAFNVGNALRIVEEGGVPAFVHLCSQDKAHPKCTDVAQLEFLTFPRELQVSGHSAQKMILGEEVGKGMDEKEAMEMRVNFESKGIVTATALVLKLHKTEEGSEGYAEFLHLPKPRFTDFTLVRKKIQDETETYRVTVAVEELVGQFISETKELKPVTKLVDMESSCLTEDFFRRLPQEVEEGGNPAANNVDGYVEGHFSRIASNVSSYINMVSDAIRKSETPLLRQLFHCQVRGVFSLWGEET